MADSNIGALPLAPSVADDSLLVMEQQGQAMKLTGQMLKGYAKQGVELEFQEDLKASQEAADRAQSAAGSVVDMTVEAHASDTATVTKSMRAGKVNLDFGLPRGEQGIPGPTGATGPRGPQGAPGNGPTILGHYDTEAALRAAVLNPEVGDVYSVGMETPYDMYVFDGVTMDWKNYGPLSGGGGGVIPENVVTSEGGASIEIEGSFGGAPYTITVTGEEIRPLTASDVEYDGGVTGMEADTVQEAVDQLFTAVSDGKAVIASAVTDKGVPTAKDATFQQIADNIEQISTGGDTSDATATPGDILGGKTAYTASGKVEGIIPSLPAQTITPGTMDKTIANGQYLAGTQTIKGDPNLTSSNIKKGVSLFGVAGALESSFAATLTVKADIGAVVTAICGDTSLEALSTTGTVVLELPIEGIWKVTAVRGMAQYNTVTLEVSNQYSAELTAEVHIEWYVQASPLSGKKYGLIAASVGGYALFAGGKRSDNNYASVYDTTYDEVETYNVELTKSQASNLDGVLKYGAAHLAATSTGKHAVFAGGDYNNAGVTSYRAQTTAFDDALTRTFPEGLKADAGQGVPFLGKHFLAAASVGGYALFGGGCYRTTEYPGVDAYDSDLVRTTPTPLIAPISCPVAASNESYAAFAARNGVVNAYDAKLVRTIPAALSEGRSSMLAARAGNYILFAGGWVDKEGTAENQHTVDAYDLFMTRTTLEPLAAGKSDSASTTLNGFAIFAGDVVEVYDPYLVRSIVKDAEFDRSSCAAATVADYALFGGGYGSTIKESFDTVSVFRYR